MSTSKEFKLANAHAIADHLYALQDQESLAAVIDIEVLRAALQLILHHVGMDKLPVHIFDEDDTLRDMFIAVVTTTLHYRSECRNLQNELNTNREVLAGVTAECSTLKKDLAEVKAWKQAQLDFLDCSTDEIDLLQHELEEARAEAESAQKKLRIVRTILGPSPVQSPSAALAIVDRGQSPRNLEKEMGLANEDERVGGTNEIEQTDESVCSDGTVSSSSDEMWSGGSNSDVQAARSKRPRHRRNRKLHKHQERSHHL